MNAPTPAPAPVPVPVAVQPIGTVGVSPKALNPALAGLAVGVVLIVVALVGGDSTLLTVAVTVLLSSAGYSGIAYKSSPGKVLLAVGRVDDPATTTPTTGTAAKWGS